LYRYECVTVPGFGAFLTHFKSASLDTSHHTFYPPSKAISFNEQLQNNDGLLANYLSEVYSISFEDAVKAIHQEVVGWKKTLHQGALELSSLGVFVFNKEQKIVFTPSNTHNHLMASFGLGAVVSPAVKRTPMVSVAKTHSGSSLWKVAAVGLLLLGVAGVGYFNNQSIHQEQQLAATTTVQKAVFDLGTIPSITLSIPVVEERFHVVAGAFRVPSNADKKLEQLLQKGYRAKRLSANKYGLHPVVFESFSDRDDAVQRLREIQRTESKDAWILATE
jgi:hypothetical protein